MQPLMITAACGLAKPPGGEPDSVADVVKSVALAAKAGAAGFTRAIAKSAGRHGVRANCVAISATRTPATAAAAMSQVTTAETPRPIMTALRGSTLRVTMGVIPPSPSTRKPHRPAMATLRSPSVE